jgi:hypothetical protein
MSVEETFSELTDSLGKGFLLFAFFVLSSINLATFNREFRQILIIVFFAHGNAGYKKLFEVIMVQGFSWSDTGFRVGVKHTGKQLKLSGGHFLFHLVGEADHALVVFFYDL